MKILFIVLGGGLGALLRYGVSGFVYRFADGVFPWGTMGVNFLGSFITGFFWELSERFIISPDIRVFLFIGLLGSFTTFSTYSLETFSLFRDGEIRLALMNIVLSNLFGIALIFLGFALSRYLFSLLK